MEGVSLCSEPHPSVAPDIRMAPLDLMPLKYRQSPPDASHATPAREALSSPPAALVIGNSDGIGLALTRLLLDAGWSVAGVSRRASAVRSAAYEHTVQDVREASYPAQLADIVARLPELTACIYCAGIGEFLDVETLAAERAVFETNLIGAVATAQVVIPAMVRARRGHFIGVSSQADGLIDSRAPSYAASKAGLTSYLEGLALATRPHGVSVTNVRLGFVDTKMAKSAVRPFMIPAEAAARRIYRSMQRRPIRDTYPKRMAVLLYFVRLAASIRRWLPSGRA